jgi:ribonuclease E
MKKSILISKEGSETRSCLLVSGKLVNIDAEGPSGASIIGNIYKGVITDVNRALNAAFVDIGEGKEGFLSIQDVHPAILEGYGKRPTMGEIFQRKQELLVQVLRDPIEEKGPMLTTSISLPGRYVVLMPAAEKVGISKKLPDDERKRLREIVEQVDVPDGFGIIVRTAGHDRKKQEIVRDLNQLSKLWTKIEKVYHESKAPSVVVREQSVGIRFLREYLSTEMDEVVVDDKEVYEEVSHFLDLVMPRFKKNLKLYQEGMPLFVRFGVENQIEKMFLRDVPLPSGGRIVIDKTEALIAIDVNSGRQKGKTVEDTVVRANLEAADEIAAQLLLRDLGGLIVIDFIDMINASNRTKVQQRLREGMKADKAKSSIGRISQFGLLEMTRQKLRSGIVSRATEKCAHCDGVGYRRTTPSDGLHILRRVRELAAAGGGRLIRVTAPVEVANFMQNSLRNMINELEQERGVRVVIEGDPTAHSEVIEQERIEEPRKQQRQRRQPAPVEAPVYQSGKDEESAEPKQRQPRNGNAKADDKQKEDERAQPKKEGARRSRGRRPRRSQAEANRTEAGRTEEKQEEKQEQNQEQKKSTRPDKPAEPRPEGTGRRRSRGRRRPARERTEEKAAAAADTGRPAADKPDDKPDVAEPAPYTYPRRAPTEVPAFDSYEPGRDGLLDKVLKKLLGLDR